MKESGGGGRKAHAYGFAIHGNFDNNPLSQGKLVTNAFPAIPEVFPAMWLKSVVSRSIDKSHPGVTLAGFHDFPDSRDWHTRNVPGHSRARPSREEQFVILSAMQCVFHRRSRKERQGGYIDLGGDTGLDAQMLNVG